MYLLRHGQSEFNVHFARTRIDPGIEDPAPTELGRVQARAAATALALRGLTRIVASPYRRTLETAAVLADPDRRRKAVEFLLRRGFDQDSAWAAVRGRVREEEEDGF